ncbi:hypothetical protein MYAM1_003195 [Malassezia yamatoensis]|uniref:Xylanolytic transcriptional activator regulatory domain-containing protein n=1 Tax=Malassezia yamatoensis TaxID=253288 RepID=A0AAJ5YVW9_9BASI|nr:hypothetical protein MYAM1_003195 [Malassezia yamatoensis]
MPNSDYLYQRPSGSEPGAATLPFGPTYAPTPSNAIHALPLPWENERSDWSTPNSFADPSQYGLPPNFGAAGDVHRSASQPGNKRRTMTPMEWSTARNNRDTLYAHEFLKAFRARMPDSAEGQAACDYCRKRKIKVEFVHRMMYCASVVLQASTSIYADFRRERAMMDNAGIVFRSRSSRASKNNQRREFNDNAMDLAAGPSKSSNQSSTGNVAELDSFVMPTTTAGMQPNGELSKSIETLDQEHWAPPNVWLSANQANVDASSTPAKHTESMRYTSQPSGLDMNLLPNMPTNDTWINDSDTNWHTFANAPTANHSSTSSLPPNPSDNVHFHSSDSHHSFAPSLDMPLSSLFAMDERGVFPQDHSNASSKVPTMPAAKSPRFDSKVSKQRVSSKNQDMSLLTEPMTSADSMDDAQKLSSAAQACNRSTDQPRPDHSCRAALNSFLHSNSVSNMATRHIADSLNQHPAETGMQSSNKPSPKSYQSCFTRRTAADAMCMRAILKDGSVDYVALASYPQSLASVFQTQDPKLEHPGDTWVSSSVTAAASNNSSEATLFPTGQWDENDYGKLREAGRSLLQQPHAETLLNLVKEDLHPSLPFLQWNVLEQYMLSLTKSAVLHWTPTQTRQREALILILVAVSSTLHSAIDVSSLSQNTPVAASPWLFGLQSYRLARGLLTPRSGHLVAEEATLEYVTSLILLNMYLSRCKRFAEASTSLARAVGLCLHLVHQPDVQPSSEHNLKVTVYQREMLKRCLWVLYLLDRSHQIETRGQSTMLFTDAIGTLELPVLLRGVMIDGVSTDQGVSQEDMNKFISQIKLAQLFGEFASQGFFAHESSASVPGSSFHSAALVYHSKFKHWESQTPCIQNTTDPSPMDPTNSSWTTPSTLNFQAHYKTCLEQLHRFSVS